MKSVHRIFQFLWLDRDTIIRMSVPEIVDDRPCSTDGAFEVSEYEKILALSTPDYITHAARLTAEVIKSSDYLDPETGYISRVAWKTLVDGWILAAAMKERDPENRTQEHLEIIRNISRMDPQLGLMYGVMTALAIENFHKFGSEAQKSKYFDLMRQGELFGLAFTETDLSGSTLEMNSSFSVDGNGKYRLKFNKRWQGLSGGYLIVAARDEQNPGKLGFFIVDKGTYQTELFETEGLERLPYGYNSGDVLFGEENVLTTLSIKKDMPIIQRVFADSRAGFGAMALGQEEQIEDLARAYAEKRLIGVLLQKDMPDPMDVLNGITARRIITESIFHRVIDFLTANTGYEDLIMEASMIKTLSTEYSHESALEAATLGGANSYFRKSRLKDAIDRWPFKTFEGNNNMLFIQLGHIAARKRLYDEGQPGGLFDRALAAANLTAKSKADIDGIIGTKKNQVLDRIFGQIATRCFALGCIDKKNWSPEEFTLATELLNMEIQMLVVEYRAKAGMN